MRTVLIQFLLLTLLVTPLAAREHYIRLDARGQDLAQIGRQVSIDHGKQDPAALRAYATDDQLRWLEKQAIEWIELPHPGINPDVRMGLLESRALRAWNAYPTYGEYLSLMQDLANSYPGHVQLVDIGDSQLGRELWVLKISDNPQQDEDEPEVFYTSTMHGDETTGYVLLLRLADELATLYGSDPQISHLVNNLEIWINPLANPDGTYAGGDNTINGATRGLANGWDQNRNFPDPQDGEHPDGNPWAPETVAMTAFAESRNFVLSANFHGGAEVFNFPWDTWNLQHADEDWYISLGQLYANHAQSDGAAGYFDDVLDSSLLLPGVTNGFNWYEVNGGRQDFMNYWQGCREVTIELSQDKNPPGSALPGLWTANRQALLSYLEQALTGVRGIVQNEQLQPLDATVEVVAHDRDNSQVFTDPLVGDYHRLLSPGSYSFRFSAWGHEELQVDNVVLADGSSTRLDIILQSATQFPVHGYVTDPGGTVIPNASIEVLGTPLGTVVSNIDGAYITGNLMGGTYSFRVSAPGYETGLFTRAVNILQMRQDFGLAPLDYQYAEDFEGGNGGLVSAPGEWSWGIPGGNSPAAYSGIRLWATNLTGDYPNNADWTLNYSNLQVPVDNPRLRFRQWYSMEGHWDGGQIRLVNNSGNHLLLPDSGYPDSAVYALSGPGYTGATSGWVLAEFDLSAYAGQTVDLQWRLASDSSITRSGWFLDDIQVTGHSAQADFTTADAHPAPGAPVVFVDRSSGPAQGWSWEFGDGGTSIEVNPSHIYTAPGTYLVRLTVDYPTGSSVATKNLQVGPTEIIFSDGFE